MNSYILFYSTNYAIWCNDELTERGIDNKMTSVPRELSSDCGYCIAFYLEDLNDVKKTLNETSIEFDRIEVAHKNN